MVLLNCRTLVSDLNSSNLHLQQSELSLYMRQGMDKSN